MVGIDLHEELLGLESVVILSRHTQIAAISTTKAQRLARQRALSARRTHDEPKASNAERWASSLQRIRPGSLCRGLHQGANHNSRPTPPRTIHTAQLCATAQTLLRRGLTTTRSLACHRVRHTSSRSLR